LCTHISCACISAEIVCQESFKGSLEIAATTLDPILATKVQIKYINNKYQVASYLAASNCRLPACIVLLIENMDDRIVAYLKGIVTEYPETMCV
jgi:hypothetical protein